MAEHPIDKRARNQVGAPDMTQTNIEKAWSAGARFGYDAALSDMKKRLAAAESCVEYLRTMADAQDVLPTASKKLVKAYDDAVKEAGNGG